MESLFDYVRKVADDPGGAALMFLICVLLGALTAIGIGVAALVLFVLGKAACALWPWSALAPAVLIALAILGVFVGAVIDRIEGR